MNLTTHQIDLIINSMVTITSVVIGYFLAIFKDWISNNQLRLCLLKAIWKDTDLPEPKFSPGSSKMIMPCPVSSIENIIGRSLLDNKKFQHLLLELLELRGWYYNFNALSQITNSVLAIHDKNESYESHIYTVSMRMKEQAAKVRSEIKRLYPKEEWK